MALTDAGSWLGGALAETALLLGYRNPGDELDDEGDAVEGEDQ